MIVTVACIAILSPIVGIVGNVAADTAPPSGLPATVSIDPLPTVQVNGIVWAQVTVGDTVYATGRFTQARPAGVAVGGAGTVTRSNLLAFDITTGVLKTNFVHSVTGTGTVEGRSIAVSPDGTRLYVGGKFSAVDGMARSNIAAFDLPSNTLVNGFSSGTNNTVRAIAATNTRVYIGGSFTQAGGQTRQKLAAYEKSGTLVSAWNPSVTVTGGPSGASVSALVVAPTQGNLVIGGYFNRIGTSTYLSSGAVKLDTGALVPWASQSPSYRIRDQLNSAGVLGDGTSINSLSIDSNGAQVYLTSYAYVSSHGDGTFEGRAAIDPANGNIIWANDCRGDSYSAFPIGQVLYSTNHSHDCRPIGAFPEVVPRHSQRALAETTYATGFNTAGGSTSYYPDYSGFPRGTQLNWYPTLNTGTYSGSGQAAWSVTGNTNYISLGGEFTKTENVAQQGLVRYGIASKAPNKYGPIAYKTYGVIPMTSANSSGQATISFKTTADNDNTRLTYALYRNGGSTPIYTTTAYTTFWNTPSITFTDSGLIPGSYNRYRMVVTDPFGNSTTTYSLYDDNNPAIAYSAGNWVDSQARGNGDFGGGIHYSLDNGAKATFTFTGTNIALVTEKNADRGTISVSVDGGAATTVSVYAASFAAQQTVYSKTGMTNDLHTITVTKLSGSYIDIDGFLVK